MPWIALHLFYIMILTLFSWMNAKGKWNCQRKRDWQSGLL